MKLVDDCADRLRASADRSEDLRDLDPESAAILRDSTLFAALTPSTVGGHQVDPITEMEIIAAVASIDPSIGWAYWALAGSTARAASQIPAAAIDVVFPPSGKFPLIAFDERPYDNRVIVSADGDTAHVSGRWQFGSGVTHADWVLAIGNDGDGGLRAAVVPHSEVTVHDTWHPSGLSGSGTVSYSVDTQVPASYTWSYPPGMPLRGGAHFCARRAAVKHLGFAIGVGVGSLDHFTRHLAKRGDRAAAGAVADLARAEMAMSAVKALGEVEVGRMWSEAMATLAVGDNTYLRLLAAARWATEIALDVCNLAARYGDASMLARQNPLQRNLRDIAAAAAHGEISPTVMDRFGHTILRRTR
ncbi:hypothetical protein ACIGO9_28625 [Nocardia asteroides]|uniref:hypothetical protein n=1 Tax=Nocardia asteroides TaxID=1824 RepID=UPI0037CAF54D